MRATKTFLCAVCCLLFWTGAGMSAQAKRNITETDLYQFHWPDEVGTPVEDSWAAMAKLVQEGKVRAAGVSNFDVNLLERCEAIRHVDSLQPPFSLVHRTAAEKFRGARPTTPASFATARCSRAC